jgi:hypothetical protein
MFDFNFDTFNIGDDIITSLYGKKLILKNIQLYDGPITLQFLPYGGIQSVFDYNLIINTRQGFIIPSLIIYDDIEYKIRDFISKYTNLVNLVLPN